MALKLMYITDRPDIAAIAENAGVDRIFVDMEYIGKSDRQGGMDTVQSHHTAEDAKRIKQTLTKAQLLVRCNPIHQGTAQYPSSKEEIDRVVESGANIIMLPYFKTAAEVQTFVDLVGGRAKTMPLLETKEAVAAIDEILAIHGIDELYIGLNDLSLSLSKRFMFQPLAEGLVDELAQKCRAKGIPFGFGGIASIGQGMLPSEHIIREHHRLGSTAAILSRSFCNLQTTTDKKEIQQIFEQGVTAIRTLEQECARGDAAYFAQNRKILQDKVGRILALMDEKR